ncbi:ABC transporter permease [Clostridium algoriphilum]|uniref:methionine ABC transporter permease n=1 Tax=Clostridium algoriphilum TaxID=198347 RepID=UPI001CF25B60|nr:methionine ABC transporter permease [Clostridium algoriphilum]MCB2294824.1 ABC transporter permease [Clostridium algoriphilum]
MVELLNNIMPNVVEHYDDLVQATGETLIMVFIAGIISLTLGSILGIALVVTDEGQLYENKIINNILGKIINTIRSIPFVILLALLVTFTKFIVGTSIGIKGAIVPMIVGITPFISRLIEQAIIEVDKGVIEAALAMGLKKHVIITSVLLKEAMPGIIRALIICIINLIGLSAMAGTVGGGGLGDFAIRYGYARYMIDITLVTVLILLILVNMVQGIGNIVAKRITH